MRIAVVVGVAVPHDAISSAAIQQVAALRSLPEVAEVRLFTQGLHRDPGCEAFVIGNPWELLRHPAFRSCDVAIFHWGIHYALFDAITLLSGAGSPTAVVHFHNCTPPSLVAGDERDHLLRSIAQLHHVIAMGVPTWTYSEFNRRTLVDWGAADTQIDWVTFPIPTPPPPSQPREDGELHLLSVGRLVPAKGVAVLLDALDPLPDDLLSRTRVRIVSATTFSSDDYRQRVDAQLRRSRPVVAEAVELLASPSDGKLASLYTDADVVVSTSFHEGLCVPIIEGYAAGCRAIGTTAGNLPYIVTPPDPVVAPGDPAALAASIESVAANLVIDDPAYHERRADLVESFTARNASTLLQRALLAAAG
jgi:glycosyltransferase involved in cell wall biosynthesis